MRNKSLIQAAVLAGAIALAGCHNRLTGDSSDNTQYGVPPHTVAGANLYHGTINGEAADVLIYKGGDHINGNINVGKTSGRLSGRMDPNVMDITAEPLSPVGGPFFTFTTIRLQRDGIVWNVISGGTGSITHE